MAIVSLYNVEKTYPLGKTEVHAVKAPSPDPPVQENPPF